MLEKAELTLIIMLSKTKKVITTPPPVLCSVASCKLFYSTVQRVGTLSLLFVPPAKGGGMEIIMYEDIFQFIRNEVEKRNLRERMVVSFDVCRQWIIFTNFDNRRAQKFSFRKDEMDMIIRF